MPRVPFRSYSFHGGAGAIISAGLLQRVDAGELEKCVKGLKAPGGHPLAGHDSARWAPLTRLLIGTLYLLAFLCLLWCTRDLFSQCLYSWS